MPTCSYCQTENPDEAPLCRECGRPLPRPVAAVASGGQLGPPAVGDCQVCHSPVPPDAQFCPNCGMSLAAVEYGSFGRRLGAFLLDYALGYVVGFVVAIIVAAIISILGVFKEGPEPERDPATMAFIGIWLLGAAAYHIVMNAYGGGLGKRALGMRVQNARTGENIGLGRSFVRLIVAFLSTQVLFLGHLWCIWDKKRQTWHDKAAGSVVVRT